MPFASNQQLATEDSVAVDTQKFRSQMGHISRHSGVFFLGTMFTALAGYLFKLYVARMLGAEALGIFALGMTFVGFLGVFAALGLPQSAVRFVALYNASNRHEDLRTFLTRALGLLFLANICLVALLVVAGPWVSAHLYHTPEIAPFLPMFAALLMLGALTNFFGQVLQGYKDVSRRTIITNFVGTPVMMLISIVLIATGYGLRGYLVAQVASGALVVALLTLSAWSLSPDRTRQLTGRVGKIEGEVFAFGAAVFGVGLLEFLLGQIDKVLIGVYINPRQVGIYSVAMAIVTFVPVALQSVNQIFSPTIADLHTRGEHELLRRLFQTLTKWILGLTLPLAIVVIVFARPLMGMFGEEFSSGWVVLVIGTLGQLVNCASGSVGYMLLMSGNQNRLVKIQSVMTAVIITLNILMIPRWGILGAAIAAASTNAISNLWYLREVKKALGISPYNRGYLRLVAPAALVVCTALALRSALPVVQAAWVTIGIAILLCYGALMAGALFTGLSADDRLIVEAVWLRLRSFLPKKAVTV